MRRSFHYIVYCLSVVALMSYTVISCLHSFKSGYESTLLFGYKYYIGERIRNVLTFQVIVDFLDA